MLNVRLQSSESVFDVWNDYAGFWFPPGFRVVPVGVLFYDYGNEEERARLIAKILEADKRTDIPLRWTRGEAHPVCRLSPQL
jgi:hypothetical protein